MNWSKGITLITSITKGWSKEEIERNDRAEGAMIFSNFSPRDEGRSRQRVCVLNENHPEFEENRALILAAPLLLENLKRIVDRIEENELQDHFPSAYKRAKEAIEQATINK